FTISRQFLITCTRHPWIVQLIPLAGEGNRRPSVNAVHRSFHKESGVNRRWQWGLSILKLRGDPSLDDGFGRGGWKPLPTSTAADHYVGTAVLSLAIPLASAV